jgi:hypothetical protein
MNNELERIWDEVVAAYFMIPYYHGICPGRLRKTTTDLMIVCLQAEV